MGLGGCARNNVRICAEKKRRERICSGLVGCGLTGLGVAGNSRAVPTKAVARKPGDIAAARQYAHWRAGVAANICILEAAGCCGGRGACADRRP